MNTYRLDLPWPPSVNRWLRVARGRVIKSKPWREWIEGAGMVVYDTFKEASAIGVQGVQVSILLEAPTRRVYDIDNRAKAILDALEAHGVLESDALIDRLTITRGERYPGGRARVVVKW